MSPGPHGYGDMNEKTWLGDSAPKRLANRSVNGWDWGHGQDTSHPTESKDKSLPQSLRDVSVWLITPDVKHRHHWSPYGSLRPQAGHLFLHLSSVIKRNKYLDVAIVFPTAPPFAFEGSRHMLILGRIPQPQLGPSLSPALCKQAPKACT